MFSKKGNSIGIDIILLACAQEFELCFKEMQISRR